MVPPEMMDKLVTVTAQSDKGPESYPEPEEDYVECVDVDNMKKIILEETSKLISVGFPIDIKIEIREDGFSINKTNIIEPMTINDNANCTKDEVKG